MRRHNHMVADLGGVPQGPEGRTAPDLRVMQETGHGPADQGDEPVDIRDAPGARVPAGGTRELLMYAVSSTLEDPPPRAPEPTSPIQHVPALADHNVGQQSMIPYGAGGTSSLLPHGAPMQINVQSPWMQQRPPMAPFQHSEWATPAAPRSPDGTGHNGAPAAWQRQQELAEAYAQLMRANAEIKRSLIHN